MSGGAMSFASFREHKLLYLAVGLLVAVPGLFLGPGIMTPTYRITQPVLGGANLLVLEIVFALIIDFPLAMLTSLLICRVSRAQDPADGALAGVFFLVVFGALIVACSALRGLSPIIDSLDLSEAFPLAMSTAREQLGPLTLGLMMALFGLFDLVLCTLAGVAGFYWSTAFRRGGTNDAARA